METIRHVLLENLPGYSYGPVAMFLYNLLLSIFLSWILGMVYTHFAETLSNRKRFARIFPLLAGSTMIIISFVKSSLALSLGLVGALSIIRFRSAIKEPEELAYLFLCIAIGIGCGAGFSTLTIVALFVMLAVVIILRGRKNRAINEGIYLNIRGKGDRGTSSSLENIFEEHSKEFRMKRSDWEGNDFDLSYHIVLENTDKLRAMNRAIEEQLPGLRISFVDSSREY